LKSAGASALGRKALVLRLVNAFNARNLDGLIACLHPEVDFYPLRLIGIDRSYRGHSGVRCWFDRLDELRYRHRIELSEIREARRGQLLASGALHVAEYGSVAPFCATHWVRGGLIVLARHYPRDPDLVEGIDLFGPAVAT
jgi:SnoaL-like domain